MKRYGVMALAVVAMSAAGCGGDAQRAATNRQAATNGVSRLRVSDDRRYFVDTASGAPFVWIGDTAWMLFSKLCPSDVDRYFDDRIARGFTVVQAYMVPWDARNQTNCRGEYAFNGGDMGQPNAAYFDHVEWIIDRAREKGLELAVGPAELGSSFDLYYEAGAAAYGDYLAARFGKKSNLVWMMCGDADPNAALPSVRAMASAIKNGAPNHLMTCHTYAPTSSKTFLRDEWWLDFDMAQTWAFRDRAYDLVYADVSSAPTRPAGLGEPAYEDDASSGSSDAYAVRRMAYFNAFAGGAYLTYGQTPLWNFDPGWEGLLDRPGAKQVASAYKNFVSSRRVWEYAPDASIVTQNAGSGLTRNVAMRANAGDRAMVYISTNTEVEVRLDGLTGGDVRATFYAPDSGATSDAGTFPGAGAQRFAVPGGWEDAVLFLDASGGGGGGGGGGGTVTRLAYFPLDEGSGSTVGDQTGNGNQGTFVNGPWWAAGRFASGLAFGGGDWVDFPRAVIGGRDTFSISAWFRMASSRKGVVYSEGSASGSLPILYVSINENTAGDAEFGAMSDDGTWGGVAVPGSGLDDGAWHHLCAIARGGARALWIDGSKRAEATMSVPPAAFARSALGRLASQSVTNFFDGAIDDVRLYDGALDDVDVAALAAGAGP
jgi:Protein of unknown function (DUF4038)/Concanavalin A-like lectin/glucanases superfamily/Putative collagen-binding domain of a collagenase